MPGLRTPIAAFFGGPPSVPEPFGYKMGWIAIRSTDPDAVSGALRLRSRKAGSWRRGIEAACKGGSVFISPPVRGWVCVVGQWAAGTGESSSVQAVVTLVADLSSRFGEAQGFASQRVFEYHHWILAKHGEVLRCFAYLGERGEVMSNSGEITEAEKLRFGARPPEGWYPGEQDVMAVASAWSLDPTKLNPDSAPAANGIIARVK